MADRPVIHVPLIVRRAGQQEGRTIAVTADQTSLAPTILELAGASRPESMRSPSLVPLLDQSQTAGGEGRAFCQYFERNSVFRPIQHGTVGVVDQQFQYIVTIDSQKGALRPLSEAQDFRVDRSAAYPVEAETLRNSLHERFPDLVRKTV
jgi:arylsulfatase A-like enzyme